MSSYHSSTQSQASAGPSKPPSEGDSYRVYGCKWAWCRSTFSNSAELSTHVIHEHARRAVPVRRRDIPLIRRAEEGTGESLTFSYVLNNHSSNSMIGLSQKSAEGTQGGMCVLLRPKCQVVEGLSSPASVEPFSSLPSPPATSRAVSSPLQNAGTLPGNTGPVVPSEQALYMGDIIAISATDDTSSVEQDENMRSFASLSSPTESSGSFAAPDIPNSPCFSSLVERPFKHKLAIDSLEKPFAKKSRLNRQHPLSQSANSSTGSRASVEQHLTQSLESSEEEPDKDEDEDASSHESSDAEDSTSSKNAAPTSDMSQAQASESYLIPLCSSTQDTQFVGESYELLTQPPSQFQTQVMPSFPFHFHKSKSSTSRQMGHLPSSVPLPPSEYATSTPQQRQSWYQPPPSLQRSTSQQNDQPEALESRIAPAQHSDHDITRSRRSHTRSPLKSKKFRSGTLQISPPHLSQDRIIEEAPIREQGTAYDGASLDDFYDDILSQHNSQSYIDSSQPLDEFSYPLLQTQAPYESQSMSQY